MQVQYRGSNAEMTNIQLEDVEEIPQANVIQTTQPIITPYQQSQPPPTPTYDPNGANAPSLDPNVFAACNQGVANGFGAMYFNIRDPTHTQKNVPVKQSPSMHLPVIIFNLIFFALLAVAVAGYNKFLEVGEMAGMIAGSYLAYILVGCCCSDIKDYIQNSKQFEDYQRTYNNMVRAQGFFRFWIQCYHYVTVRTKRGTRRRRVVTHTATEIFRPAESVDESGEVTSIQDVTSHVFIHYIKRYYFTDDASQRRFVATFNNFVSRNRRDVHQDYSHTFDIDNFQEYVSFTALGQGGKSVIFFYIFTILGLASPYACIFERTVSRYDVGILKKLTT